MSLPDEQLRAQSRAWELMTGPRKNWNRKNFYAATRHFLHPAQLEGMMTRLSLFEADRRLSREECQVERARLAVYKASK